MGFEMWIREIDGLKIWRVQYINGLRDLYKRNLRENSLLPPLFPHPPNFALESKVMCLISNLGIQLH
jgi:hypothetical protein